MTTTAQPHQGDEPASDALAREAVLSVIVPAYNEAERLAASLPRLLGAVPAGTEVVVVDDGSRDHTAEIAAGLLAKRPLGQVVALATNQGKGAAVRAGVQAASGHVVMFMDADLATSLADLRPLLDALAMGHLAVGSRAAPGAVTEGASWGREHGGRAFNTLVRRLTSLDLRDTQCGFKAFRAPVAKLLFALSRIDGFGFDVEVLALAQRIGFRTIEVPVHWRAASGSRVRPLRDAVVTSIEVARTHRPFPSDAVMSAVSVSPKVGADPDGQGLRALRTMLVRVGPVARWEAGTLGLLPFHSAVEAERVASEVARQLPAFGVMVTSVPVREITSRDPAGLGAALAAS